MQLQLSARPPACLWLIGRTSKRANSHIFCPPTLSFERSYFAHSEPNQTRTSVGVASVFCSASSFRWFALERLSLFGDRDDDDDDKASRERERERVRLHLSAGLQICLFFSSSPSAAADCSLFVVCSGPKRAQQQPHWRGSVCNICELLNCCFDSPAANSTRSPVGGRLLARHSLERANELGLFGPQLFLATFQAAESQALSFGTQIMIIP